MRFSARISTIQRAPACLLTLSLALSLAGLLFVPADVLAQPEVETPETVETSPEEAPAEGTDETAPAEAEPVEPELREPELREPEAVEESAGDFPNPADMTSQLEDQAPGSEDTQVEDIWTAPQPTFTLHGYFRVRSELQDTFYLGRSRDIADPLSRFRPIENGYVPDGGCGSDPDLTDTASACDSETLGFANMRLRFEPTLSLSDDVRVHTQIDILDNVVLGSTPDGYVLDPEFRRYDRTPRVPLDTFSTTQLPPSTYRNGLQDSITVRRAWAEVTNRGLGQLRFGRMGSDWGLGLLANGGEGIDSDYQSDVDRIMAVTNLFGLYIIAAYDFAGEGITQFNLTDPLQIPYDAAQDDDIDQYVLAVARRTDEEEQQARLDRGDWVLNGGVYLVYRTQSLSSQGTANTLQSPFNQRDTTLVRRNADAIIADVWGQFLWQGLRVEAEAVMIGGSIENTSNTTLDGRSNVDILQFGYALEFEYRLLDDRLGLFFDHGFATGDSHVEGLTSEDGIPVQRDDDTISTFRFHPNYRVDLILWRTILRQISGAYYFRPGISYDFIRNSFGQLFGGRVDAIYSRASEPVQTPGNDPDLGLEFNASIYYRSEDGPEMLDGFYGMVQYGILFPFQGLGYIDQPGIEEPELEIAQTGRLILGVNY